MPSAVSCLLAPLPCDADRDPNIDNVFLGGTYKILPKLIQYVKYTPCEDEWDALGEQSVAFAKNVVPL